MTLKQQIGSSINSGVTKILNQRIKMLMHVRRECSIKLRVVNDVEIYCVFMFDLLPFVQIDAILFAIV